MSAEKAKVSAIDAINYQDRADEGYIHQGRPYDGFQNWADFAREQLLTCSMEDLRAAEDTLTKLGYHRAVTLCRGACEVIAKRLLHDRSK